MTIDHRFEGSVLILTINRPEKRNALTMSSVAELTNAIQTHTANPDIRGLVLTGNGAFCAGADLTSVLEGVSRESGALEDEIEAVPQHLIRTLLTLKVPTVAAIDGAAIGMGMDIALACDSRLIGEEGWLMQGWGRVGLIPGTGGVLLLRALNSSVLWKLLEEQQRITGPEATRLGLGESVEGSAVEAAVRRIDALAKMPPRAVEAYVSLQRESICRDLDAHLAECTRVQAELLGNEQFGARVGEVVVSRDRN